MFLLVLAHPGRAGPKAVKRLCVCVLPPTLISGAVVTVQ